MSIADRLTRWTVLEFVEAVAERAEDFAWAAGVGGMETAGALLSYLADHPQDIEPFMVGGISELPERWFATGRLTWMAKNGKIVRPKDVEPRTIGGVLQEEHP